MLEADSVEKLIERASIEVAPLAFMRGRTLNDSFIILDVGEALVRDDGGAGRRAVRGLAFQRLAGLVPLAVQLRIRQPEPVTVPSQVQISSSLHPQYQRE